jgi:hypothetical protein
MNKIYRKKKTNKFLLLDYFSPTPCPGSPTLPDKLLSSTSTTATLSPPGVPLTASATSLTSNSKRRGLSGLSGLSGLTSGQRASHKRAHTGRLVSNINRIYSM